MESKHIKRLNRDIQNILKDPLDNDGIYFWWNDDNITEIYVLIIGPNETPYAGGYFLIKLNFPKNYPHEHPSGYFMTQDYRKRTRLHPNLYANGKICLSLFGTWDGPSWNPTLNLRAIAQTLCSLLGENPIRNEPYYEKVSADSVSAKIYTRIVEYETIQVAVIDQLMHLENGNPILCHFESVMKEHFLKNYEFFKNKIKKFRRKGFNNLTENIEYYNVNTTYKLDQIDEQLDILQAKISSEIEEKNRIFAEIEGVQNIHSELDEASEKKIRRKKHIEKSTKT